MTDVFHADGHLKEEALLALLQNEPMDELTRLEVAEHLAYCDRCLQRYSDLLAGTELTAPERSCRETLWRRIRRRTLGCFTQRYAAAAAAVALALTLLWGSAHPDFVKVKAALVKPHIPYTEALQDRWDGTMEHTASWLSGLMDLIDPLQGRKP